MKKTIWSLLLVLALPAWAVDFDHVFAHTGAARALSPIGVAASPDSQSFYVTFVGGVAPNGQLVQYNSDCAGVVTQVDIQGPGRLAVSPDGLWVYVLTSTTLSVYTSGLGLVSTIPLSQPVDVAFAPGVPATYAFVTVGNALKVVDVSTRTVVKTISLASKPIGVVAQDLDHVYVAINDSFQPRIATVDPFTPGSPGYSVAYTALSPLASGAMTGVVAPLQLALLPPGGPAGDELLATLGGSRTAVISLPLGTTPSMYTILNSGSFPQGITAVRTSSGNLRIYVADQNGYPDPVTGAIHWDVTRIDADVAPHVLMSPLQVCKHPNGIDASPDGRRLCVAETGGCPTSTVAAVSTELPPP